MTLKEERELRKKQKLEAEYARLETMFEYEKEYSDCEYIAGIDEVGRGPLAGPVVTACVIMPKDVRIPYVNDSKKVTEKRREELYDIIKEKALTIGIGIASEKRIDEINILQATYEAMREAINNLEIKPDILLNDAVNIPGVDIKQVPIIKGDAKSFTIACASIIAKVTRDRMMVELDKKYPNYGFAKNKGYGTKQHTDALREFGPCEIHRRTFIGNFIK
ncbi:ribonuclease HII [Lachnospira multipara]|uniref:ribonuclease HII n=1 Tax=Lachnospira multipara TaxID=28051 RepID=UPI0004E225A5|nr:ribonuclease HII [Lachnospira multipara]